MPSLQKKNNTFLYNHKGLEIFPQALYGTPYSYLDNLKPIITKGIVPTITKAVVNNAVLENSDTTPLARKQVPNCKAFCKAEALPRLFGNSFIA